ncbi:class I SAM-dependent DNA methyltransferase [Methylobacterium sp. J-070]|uniref:class I SAM-dependent DNA methyltransferase n=1 Tax=Methylobacterium sp. J-070 TaxID=2836650 RepID=UPI001FBA06EC|nr:class I SAM-dependent DNA methyltransferase [Methylobacterium sp. J-070]MCJ2051690.1 class I SAM-dependent DNA methyltransferase [Methylobacterium sp. J-070]
MTPQQFIDRWKPVALSERAAAQSHFNDLCRLLDHPTPIEADPKGETFAFEKGLQKSGGGLGFADVWKRQHFAWEYKKRKRNLGDALDQLARYALALESPPLHIACDTDQFRVVTAWTNTVPYSYDISLDDLREPAKLDILRSAFHEPTKLRKGGSRADLTRKAADRFSSIALRLRERGHAPEQVAHLVNRLAFLFFAEDVRLLPAGFFRRAIEEVAGRPHEAKMLFDDLFAILRKGGRFGLERLPYINGGLFDEQPALPLDAGDVQLLIEAGRQDWAHIDPSIFGTLFERFLDPDKRAQIGAHYTDAEKIMRIVEPVLLRPLRAEWQDAKSDIEQLTDKARKKGPKAKEWQRAEERRSVFLERLRTLEILDPACGSGNFLYMALHAVKDLEHAANQECEIYGLPPRMPMVGPEILRGLEINPLAAELARTTVWIGDIQWAVRNGFYTRPEPILRRLDTIECRDALITTPPAASSLSRPIEEAEWPKAEFIVGNPPFLGGKMLRRNLGDAAVDSLFETYRGRVPAEADLVTYWFEKARAQIERGDARRAGLVTTNSIRGGVNRRVLERIAADMPIFSAWADEPWIVDGAAVRVSLVCFGEAEADEGAELDGAPVERINADLTGIGANLTSVAQLAENRGVAFMGNTKGGSFDVPGEVARAWLTAPLNVNGRPNADVLRPWINGLDIVRRPRDMWLIDFNAMGSDNEAAFYGGPFAHILAHVKPERVKNRREVYARSWWKHVEARPALTAALKPLKRYIGTARVAKHRLFGWFDPIVVPDSQVIAIARDDDTTFGVLHSRFHETWSLRLGSSLEDRPRYTPTSTFETYPFPVGLTPNISATDYASASSARRIGAAAEKLHSLRSAWLNPADQVREEPEVVPGFPVRQLPCHANAAGVLGKRTLTNLYNERPRWLDDAHAELDRAVAAAYGWPEDIAIDDALARLVALNGTRAAAA